MQWERLWFLRDKALRNRIDHAPEIKNGHVLIIGLENICVNAAIFEEGTGEVVTLEYGKIHSQWLIC